MKRRLALLTLLFVCMALALMPTLAQKDNLIRLAQEVNRINFSELARTPSRLVTSLSWMPIRMSQIETPTLPPGAPLNCRLTMAE